MVTLDASMVLRNPTRRRTVAAEDFFVSIMTTALEPEELLTEITFPPCRRIPAGRIRK